MRMRPEPEWIVSLMRTSRLMDRRAAPPLQQQIEGEINSLCMRSYIVFLILGDIPKSGKMFLEENLQDNKLATNTYTEATWPKIYHFILTAHKVKARFDIRYEARTLYY